MRCPLHSCGRIVAMDAGSIAIVGAAATIAGVVVGGGFTLGAAALTTGRQAKAQHDQWRRQVRRDAYAACLTAANALLTGINDQMTSWNSGSAEETQEAAIRVRTLFATLRQAESTVKLEGPADLEPALDEMLSSLKVFAALVTGAGDSAIALPTLEGRRAAASRMRRNVVSRRASSSIESFQQQARQVLDEGRA